MARTTIDTVPLYEVRDRFSGDSVAPNPYYRVRVTSNSTNIDAASTWLAQQLANNQLATNALSDAHYACYEKLQSQLGPQIQTAVNACEGLATVRALASLVGGLRSPLKTYANFANRMTSLSPKARKRALSEVPNQYLATKFGLVPAAQDIYNAVKRLNTPKPDWLRVKVGATREFQMKQNIGSSWYPAERNVSGQHTVHMGCWFELVDPFLAELQAFGLINPASVMWELVPGSFLLDQFLPVSNFLASLVNPFIGYKLHHPWTTVVSRGSAVESTWLSPSEGWQHRTHNGFMMRRYTTILSLPFPPPLRLKQPSLGGIATLGAMVTQQLLGVKSKLPSGSTGPGTIF